MTEYTATITDLSGNTIGINPNGLRYVRNLNKANTGSFKINGLDLLTRQSVVEGGIVKIYKNGALDFEGIIINKTQFSGGIMLIIFAGSEFQVSKDNVFSTELWQATASATIFSSLMGDATSWTAGTIDTGVDIDFRVQDSDSVLNAVGNLRAKTSQDLYFNYLTKEISLLDHQGSSTSVLSLIYENNIKNITYKSTYPLGNNIKVFGKGDGSAQIVSETSSGQDASSQSTYGIIPYTVRDPTVISVDEANKLADSTVAYAKLPQKIYTFEVTDITLSTKVVEGDVVTIDAPEYDLNEEEVRIVSIERGFEGEAEVLIFQVTNKDYAKAQRKRNDPLAEIDKSNRDSQTYMQGTTNVLTFSQQINGTSTASLRVQGNLPDSFIRDEAGNLRVESFTVDYDVDPFRSSVGTASEDNVAPDLNDGETDSHKHDASDSGHPHSNATQTSTANYAGDFEGSDSATGVSCSSGTWTTICSEFVGGAASLVASFELGGNSGGAEDIQVRLRNSGTSQTYNAEFGIYMDAFRNSSFLVMRNIGVGPATSDYIYLEVYPESGAITLDGFLSLTDQNHTHSISSWNTNSATAAVSDSNKTPGLNGNAESHNHNVSVGDDVSDAGSINATSVNLYVDWWSGSAWINKHSILNTGKTIDTDVDISNGGTLPDAAGFWRTRITTDSATADLINGIMKLKHELDT